MPAEQLTTVHYYNNKPGVEHKRGEIGLTFNSNEAGR